MADAYAPTILGSSITSNSSTAGIQNTKGLLGFFAYGTFNTCTCVLDWSPDGTNWFAVPNASVTDASLDIVQVPIGFIRATVSSVGASTDVSVGVMPVEEGIDY